MQTQVSKALQHDFKLNHNEARLFMAHKAETKEFRDKAWRIVDQQMKPAYERLKSKMSELNSEEMQAKLSQLDQLRIKAGNIYTSMCNDWIKDRDQCRRALTDVENINNNEFKPLVTELDSTMSSLLAEQAKQEKRTRVTAEAEARMTAAIQAWQTLLANNELGLRPGALDITISEMQEKLVEVKAASLEDYPGVLNTFLGLVKAMESGFKEASFRNNAAIEQEVGNRLLNGLFGAVKPPTPEVLNAVPEEATVEAEEAEEPDNVPKPRINS